jgi:hypothetical protein
VTSAVGFSRLRVEQLKCVEQLKNLIARTSSSLKALAWNVRRARVDALLRSIGFYPTTTNCVYDEAQK